MSPQLDSDLPFGFRDAIQRIARTRSLNSGIQIIRQRAASFSTYTGMMLAGIGMDPAARTALDSEMTRAFQRSSSSYGSSYYRPSNRDEVIIGAGLHAAIYAANRVKMGYPRPLVLERGYRPGGTFAMTSTPAFRLNSGNRPGLLGQPGSQEALNVIPGALIQPSQLSSAEYQSNDDLGYVIRTTLAAYADVVIGREVTGVDTYQTDGFPSRQQFTVTTTGGMEFKTARLLDARGLGNERDSDSANGRNVLTFFQLMNRMGGVTFPLEGMSRVAVIGDGDSAKCAVESLLGIGPVGQMSAAALDYVQKVDWYGPNLSRNCEDWKASQRGRYARLGTYLPRTSGDRNARVRIYRQRAEVVAAGDSVLVNGQTYSHAILCTGYELPDISGYRYFDTFTTAKSSRRVASQPLAKVSESASDFYKIGTAAGLDYSRGELDDSLYTRNDQNKVAIFRLANRTAALAASLPRVRFDND